MNDTTPTPLSQQAAEPSDPPSWHGPVQELRAADARHDARLATLESGFARLEQKTDAQTIILTRLDKVAANPYARAIFVALALAFAAWLSRHGVKVEIPQ